jgi:hypothetical protein
MLYYILTDNRKLIHKRSPHRRERPPMSATEVLPICTGYEVGTIYAEAAELGGETLYRSRSPKALANWENLHFPTKPRASASVSPNLWATTNLLTSSSTPATASGECRSSPRSTCEGRISSARPAPTSAENVAAILPTTLTCSRPGSCRWMSGTSSRCRPSPRVPG